MPGGLSYQLAERRRQEAQRQRDFWAQIEKEQKIAKIMKKYDKEGNGKLNQSELGVMLQDLAGGEEPTDEEKSFVLKAADESDNKVDGYISK